MHSKLFGHTNKSTVHCQTYEEVILQGIHYVVHSELVGGIEVELCTDGIRR